MSAMQPQFGSANDFLNFYMDHDIPEWLYPFDIRRRVNPEMTVTEEEKDGLKYSFVKGYNPDDWCSKFPIAKPVPYIPGEIACVEVGGNFWAISSEFSGCYMAAFSFINNPQSRYVCHIAYGDGKCKDELYNALKDNPKVNIHCMFAPYDIVDTDYAKTIDGSYAITSLDTYGLITGNNECYTFVIGHKNHKYRILTWVKWEFGINTKTVIEGSTKMAEPECKSDSGCLLI